MTCVRQRAFPAHIDSLRPARVWSTTVLSRAGAAEDPCAHAVLLLHELTAQTLEWLTPEHATGASLGLYVRADIGTIIVGTVCESHRLARSPADGLLRRYRRTLLDSLANEHGATRDGFLCTRYAELRWRVPEYADVPTPRTPNTCEGLSFQPRISPPPGGPALN